MLASDATPRPRIGPPAIATARCRAAKCCASAAAGFAGLALAGLLADEAAAGRVDPLAVRPPHFPPRAKRVIFLFMHGGPSQVDTFDYKPLLTRDHGKPLPFAKPRVVSSETGNLLASPWKFAQHGQSGAWVSELFPHVAGVVDDLCLIHSMHGSNSRHGGALLELHTGSDTFVRPSMGSWITYGLGTENQDLPGFITICPTLTHGGENNYGSAFLPAAYQGTRAGQRQHSGRTGADPLHRKWPGFAAPPSGWSSTCCARWSTSTWPPRGPTWRWRGGSTRSSWLFACRPPPRGCKIFPTSRRRCSSSTASTTRRRRISAASA